MLPLLAYQTHMKAYLIPACLLITLYACDQQKQVQPEVLEAPAMDNQTESQLHIPKEQLASDKDPVCLMSVADSQADTMTFGGKLYGFCGTGCKEAFAENPASFLK
jgi:YHS domain-containing protein